MRIAVIGAGISGLAIAHLIEKMGDVAIFESGDKPGGLVQCDIVNGSLFHKTGGHVFNTKFQHVLDWFWSFFDRDSEFVKADRNASIILANGQTVGYPIENHVFQLDDDTLRSFIGDMSQMLIAQIPEPKNFEEFLKSRFGCTLYNLYFRPYNTKVWRRDLSDVPLSWLEGKLPMPTVDEMIYNNVRQVKEKKFVHSSFYYPKTGGSQFIADRLAIGLDIRYGTHISQIERACGKWHIDGNEFDKVIYTGNVKALPKALVGIDISDYTDAIQALEAHGTTSVFCEIDGNPYSWIYLPSADYEAHRIICTGNFAETNNNSPRLTATVEFTDSICVDCIKKNLEKMPYHPVYITHNYAEYTYPIQDKNTRTLISGLSNKLAPDGLYLLGRFAEWEYYNMDAAIASAINLSTKLSQN